MIQDEANDVEPKEKDIEHKKQMVQIQEN